MAYKTCENCGCRVYAQGCVNCDEMEYISMQEDYVPPRTVAKNLQQADVIGSLPDANPHQCALCGWGCTCSDQPCTCCSGNDA